METWVDEGWNQPSRRPGSRATGPRKTLRRSFSLLDLKSILSETFSTSWRWRSARQLDSIIIDPFSTLSNIFAYFTHQRENFDKFKRKKENLKNGKIMRKRVTSVNTSCLLCYGVEQKEKKIYSTHLWKGRIRHAPTVSDPSLSWIAAVKNF